MGSLARIRTAAALLTALPVGRGDVQPADFRLSVPFFTFVGGLVGAIIGTVGLFSTAVGFNDHVAATFMVMATFVVTRGMHWDAISDIADAWWSREDIAARLQVMADPHVGAFGVFAQVITVALAVGAYATIVHDAQLVIPISVAAAAAGRASAVFGAYLGQPAKSTGLGASVAGPGTIWSWALALGSGGVVVLVTGVLYGVVAPLVALYAVGAIIGGSVAHVVASRFGGITGDVLGASILVTEVSTVLVAACCIGTPGLWG